MNTRIIPLILLFVMLALSAHAAIRISGYPINIAGGGEHRYIQPKWSPDGAYLAFTAERYRGLWVVKPNGSGMQQLTDDQAAGFGFQWSHDGKSIATRVAKFENYRRKNAVKLFHTDSKAEQLLVDFSSRMPGMPQWSEDDQHVYVYNQKSGVEMLPTGKVARLGKARLKNDIFILKNDRLARYTIAEQQLHVLEATRDWQCLNVTNSPDGNYIAFEVLGGHMYAMKTNGSGLVDLGVGNRPAWSPDSEYLIYMIAADDGHTYRKSDLYVIHRSGSEKTRLKFPQDKLEMNPSWSPDGSKIAYDVLDEGIIYVAPIAR